LRWVLAPRLGLGAHAAAIFGRRLESSGPETAKGCARFLLLGRVAAEIHREAIAKVIFLVGEVSDNGRVVTSQYHDRNFKYFQVTAKTKERLYTRATILGVRRPYRFTVEVRVERRDPQTGRFVDLGLDENLSRRQAIAIKNALTQGRENGGIFDEEAPF